MSFEVKFALTTLDSRTPAFYVTEMFAQGDMTAKRATIAALATSLADKGATRMLIQKLKLF